MQLAVARSGLAPGGPRATCGGTDTVKRARRWCGAGKKGLTWRMVVAESSGGQDRLPP